VGWQRIRTIKPAFFQNEELAGLPGLARLLFIGLWTVADREGRLEDRPRRLKAQILPYDDADVDALLTALAGARFITRYSVDGVGYIEIPHFGKHQRPHPNEFCERFPGPPPRATLVSLNSMKSREKIGKNAQEEIRKGKEEIQEETHTGLSPSVWDFSDFWAAYPKKRHKPDAKKAWRQVDADRMPWPIRDGLERWKGSDAWRRGFVEDPSTFLRQRQWEDEPTAAPHVDPRTADNMDEIKRGLGLIGRAKGWDP